MIQFFYERAETDRRIPLPQKTGSEQAKNAVDQIHARYQPDQPSALPPGFDHSGHQADGAPLA